MAKPLTPDDFPLYAAGPHVYRRTESSPLFTAPDMQMAADKAFRFNAHEMGKWSVDAYGYQPNRLPMGASGPVAFDCSPVRTAWPRTVEEPGQP